ncbi:MAG: pyridoxamine 5'-phosphate oxidase family protein, partial [Oscillospiraceae bacterium]|nr:pyridoxamine 5'-phosphate oxidase family protein [Oscillospiraceae bacterium]
FLTTYGDQPSGRPFGFNIVYEGKLYFGCGTFKNVFKQLVANPRVEVLAVSGMDFMRYDGKAVVVKDEGLLAAVREANANLMGMYDKNGWEMGLFYLEGGHAEIRGMMELKEEFDV